MVLSPPPGMLAMAHVPGTLLVTGASAAKEAMMSVAADTKVEKRIVGEFASFLG